MSVRRGSGLVLAPGHVDRPSSWRGHLVFLSSVLAGEDIGFEEVSDERWSIAFGPRNLAYLHPSTMELTPAVFWR